MIHLSVIIPAFNEEKRLPETLKKVREYLLEQKYSYEVIIVDDGSTDKMKEVVSDLIKGWEGFRMISYRENKGKGYAVKKGMLEAKGEWRLLMDADNSTDISEVEKLFPYSMQQSDLSLRGTKQSITDCRASMPKGARNDNREPFAEVIIGSRYLDKDSIKVKQTLDRRIVSRLGNIIVRVLLGLKPLDTQCGFKLFSARATEEIFPLQTINRWGFDVEVLAIAIKKGYQIQEVPVDWYDAEGSRVRKSAIWKTLGEIYTVKRNMMRGKYGR